MQVLSSAVLHGKQNIPPSRHPVTLRWARNGRQPYLIGPDGDVLTPAKAEAVLSSLNLHVANGSDIRLSVVVTDGQGKPRLAPERDYRDSSGWALATGLVLVEAGDKVTVTATNYGSLTASLSGGSWLVAS